MNDDEGFYLTFLAIGLVAIFMIVGLAVDSTALYLHHGRLQRAADAGTIAGALQLIGGLTPTEVDGISRDVAKDNLLANGVSVEDRDIQSEVLPNQSVKDEISSDRKSVV